ncbi:hypothetical protein [Burkholderia cenocepacia]|uniref:hypothetical protein n=2 Tax=Burkholderia cenocepacia TaxID=95486 RepID=UPI002AB645EE|nr:hypothetical protein [Burkholderia cenocepacia]
MSNRSDSATQNTTSDCEETIIGREHAFVAVGCAQQAANRAIEREAAHRVAATGGDRIERHPVEIVRVVFERMTAYQLDVQVARTHVEHERCAAGAGKQADRKRRRRRIRTDPVVRVVVADQVRVFGNGVANGIDLGVPGAPDAQDEIHGDVS